MGSGEKAMNKKGYPEGWLHAKIHLNPKTGVMDTEGDQGQAVRDYFQSRLEEDDPQGLLSLIRKAEEVVDRVKGLLDRLDRDGEVRIEVSIKVPKR